MTEMTCLGLPGSWVNAWLAAVGAIRLAPGLRLRWTMDGSPRAVLCAESGDPVQKLAMAWPTRDDLSGLAIARNWGDTPPVERRVPVEVFQKRARSTRSEQSSWTLSSTMTDLDVDKKGTVAHAPFDPAGPGTIKWLHHRLLKVHDHFDSTVERLTASLSGAALRVKDNGLGFDITRLASLADDTGKWVDPVIEVLAFFGLAVLPVRGTGTDKRISRSGRVSARQRGWNRIPQSDGREIRAFVWPAWSQPLDIDGIDALLDIWNWKDRHEWNRLGVHAGWRTVRYQPRGSGDTTRGYGSEQL